MKSKIKIAWVYFIVIAILAAGFILSYNAIREGQFSRAVVSYYGSRGREVTEIQKRLKAWGYYKGAVDGIYGYQTYQAVRYFQSKNGLKVDGIAGKQTLAALGLPTGTNEYNRNLDLLARVIYGEARGEPYEGQVAVGAVILNRVADSRFPNTIPGVIYQPGAFDVVADGQINLTPNDTAYRAARDALNGWDPTYGCIYYYNPATATSKWIWSRPIVVRIGKHNFCK
ncbi:MAG TPA: spore cortex-lytic enzyme [Clostridiaceae bacterium]|jgi:N-acetylmuramoyl-L-alanine amidase|nr:spore cortex-lytic enzyme [Clostridiaceae bacterium]